MDKAIYRAISSADRARHATRAQAITPSMYMPYKVPAERMTLEQARRGLCPRINGNVSLCRQCPAPCPMGKRCMELTEEVQKA